MPKMTGNDSAGRKILPTDEIDIFYRLPDDGSDPVKLAVRSGPSHHGRGTDLWEMQEQSLERLWKGSGWEPGTYRVESYANYSSALMGTIDRPMPLPEGYARLGLSPRDGLPARSFIWRVVMPMYRTNLWFAGDHVVSFAQHYHHEISTDELIGLTGYAPPEGWVRPSHPTVTDTTVNP